MEYWRIIFVWIQIMMLTVDSYMYNFKCPAQVDSKIRAQIKCNSTLKYFCLYNNVAGKYVEGCNGPDWDRKGSKRIYAGDFSREKCIQKRYQPFTFWTNKSMSDCIYVKSICSEEGQIVYRDNSTKDDRSCRCDYKKNYSFIKTPRNVCFCIPTEEDCSCYVKSCPENITLSADYGCTQSGFQKTPQCIDITEYNKTVDEKSRACMENKHLCLSKTTSEFKRSARAAATILVSIFIILMLGGFFFEVFYGKILQRLDRYFEKTNTDGGKLKERKTQLDIEVHQISNIAELATEEVYFLRMIHILFRVACPVVRMIFNHEIHPNQLQHTLDKNKRQIRKHYGKEEDDYKSDLLLKYAKGKTVTSADFDIGLMIHLLHLLANIEVCNLYPCPADSSFSAMLSRIKLIYNEITQIFKGKLSEDQFNQYWDDIGQLRHLKKERNLKQKKTVSKTRFTIKQNGQNRQLIYL
ncbi:uncharacterized protein LOC127703828 isoform X8 [Mytilus californianus]|uniref:uncharacterized protein LOC127703828 isoform X8 n=1 Tax=Mytilus californianus TaxID=6549 RepID=UPI002247E986|nr:uncharacterized protein LOC127703828 isoform X8 [Mytilus californianus]